MKLKELLTKRKNNSSRFIEIDMIRGFALSLMIIGHILWDLDYFKVIPINNGFYSFLQQIVPQMFFVILGVGIIVSYKKKRLTPKNQNKYYKHLMKRGLKIMGLGVLLSIFSLIFIPGRPIYFGVLHCIGLSIILSIPFLKYRFLNLLFAVFILLVGYLFSGYYIQNPNIIHLIIGLHQENIWMYTVDYFPIVPWFGVMLLGLIIGDILYCGDKRRFKMPDISRFLPAKFFSWIGKHSLEIYLLHQPLIAGALYLFIFF